MARSGGPPPPVWVALRSSTGWVGDNRRSVHPPPTVQVALRSSAGGFWGVSQSKAPERSTVATGPSPPRVSGSSELDRAGCGQSRQQTPCPWLLGARPVDQGQLNDSFTLITVPAVPFHCVLSVLRAPIRLAEFSTLHFDSVLSDIRVDCLFFGLSSAICDFDALRASLVPALCGRQSSQGGECKPCPRLGHGLRDLGELGDALISAVALIPPFGHPQAFPLWLVPC